MEIQSFQEHYTKQLFAIKEEVIKKVVEQVLGKEVSSDSKYLKDFEFIIHESFPGKEFMGYKGKLIGEIALFQKEEDNQMKMGFEFIPKTEFC